MGYKYHNGLSHFLIMLYYHFAVAYIEYKFIIIWWPSEKKGD